MSKGEPSEAVLGGEEPRIRKLIRLSALVLLSPLIFSFVHEAGLFLRSNCAIRAPTVQKLQF